MILKKKNLELKIEILTYAELSRNFEIISTLYQLCFHHGLVYEEHWYELNNLFLCQILEI